MQKYSACVSIQLDSYLLENPFAAITALLQNNLSTNFVLLYFPPFFLGECM